MLNFINTNDLMMTIVEIDGQCTRHNFAKIPLHGSASKGLA